MNVRRWLERGFKLDMEIRQLQLAKENIKKLKWEGDKEKIRNFNNMLFLRINTLLDISCEITREISRVDGVVSRTLLTARYINFKTWEAIADDLEMDLRWIYRLHKKALKDLEEAMGCH